MESAIGEGRDGSLNQSERPDFQPSVVVRVKVRLDPMAIAVKVRPDPRGMRQRDKQVEFDPALPVERLCNFEAPADCLGVFGVDDLPVGGGHAV